MVAVILIFCLLVVGVRGMAMFKKLRHASRLKIGVAKFKLLNVSSQFGTQLLLQISNFSSTAFVIKQVSIDVYTPQGEQLAGQKQPLSKSFTLTPNQVSTLPIEFKVNLPVLITHLKRVGGLSSITANYITSGTYGMSLVLKGFVIVDNITLNINETITV